MRIRDLAARAVGTAVCVAAVVAQDVPASINMKPDEAKGYVFGAMKEGRIGWAGQVGRTVSARLPHAHRETAAHLPD